MELADLNVKPFDKWTAQKWNALVRLCRSCKILPGDGVRITVTPSGTVINRTSSFLFDHPWRVSYEATELKAKISKGTVNGLEPSIKIERGGEAPISGDEENDIKQPSMEVSLKLFDQDNRSWIVVEVELDKDASSVISATMKQVADIYDGEVVADGKRKDKQKARSYYPALNGNKTRYPIAMLKKINGSDYNVAVFQIAYFNLQHKAVKRNYDSKDNQLRHYFFPA